MMASTNSPVEGNIGAISKMKVVELKKELKARGLNIAGSKTELVERLQTATSQTSQDLLSEDGNAESEILDEDEVLGGEEEEEGGEFDDDDLTAEAVLVEDEKDKPGPLSSLTAASKRPAPQATETSQEPQPKKRVLVRPISVSSTGKENGSEDKVVKMEEDKDKPEANGKKILKLSGLSVKERLELRAQKFGAPASVSEKKEARAARFGTTIEVSTKSSGNTSASAKLSTNIGSTTAEMLKKRAERFGCNVSSLARKVEEKERLKKRQERFGTVSTTAAPAVSLAEKKKLRAERFKE